MTAPTAQPTRSTTARALRHMLFAGLLGVVATVLWGPLVVASLFGGAIPALIALCIVAAVVTLLAVVLDRAAGPGASGRAGSVTRGLSVGMVGTLVVAALAWVVLRQDIGADVPVPLRVAAAALPFAALAGLQWAGAVRVTTAVLVLGAVAVVLVPRSVDAAREDRTARVTTEVGTTARPWVTEVDGFAGEAPQVTGSELIWTPYRPIGDSGEPVLRLFRGADPALGVEVDPCATFSWWTPEGDQPTVSCEPLGRDRWRRASDVWQQLLERREDEWVGVAARLDVPGARLDDAVANARPMTDEEYDAWLDAVLS